MTLSTDYYENKTAVVTGAAAGVGLALAEELLSCHAASVVLIDTDGARLARQVARLNDLHRDRVFGVEGDVTVESRVHDMVKEAAETGGGIDVLFNNAGAAFSGLFDQQTNDDWTRAFALNFFGPLYGIRAALPFMRQRGGGHIVNIVSGIAFTPMAQQAAYAATKAALNALSLALRYELWDENIRVTSATPGTTATAIWGNDALAPPHAQSPARAAETILAGVARNERLVLGDSPDISGAINAFNPAAAAGMDEYLLDVARRRRRGEIVV